MRPISCLLAIAAVAVAALAPAHAWAADQPEDRTAISWSVEPATDAGVADGRAWIELSLAPGDTAQEYMLVTNRGAEPADFRLSAADGYFTDAGRFNMLPADQSSTAAGTWISLAPSVSVAAGAQALVPFTVTVPSDATPGDHPAGVAAGVVTGDSAVGVESRIGFRVMTRVVGEVVPAVENQVTAVYQPSWNPFVPGSLRVDTVIANTGNARLAAATTVTAAGPGGVGEVRTPSTSVDEFAPGESRTSSVVLDRVWPFFSTTVTVDTAAQPVPVDGGGAPASASTSVSVSTVPWSQLLLVVSVAALIVLVVVDGRRRAHLLQRQLDEAREEGRRAARRSTSTWVLLVMGVLAASMLGHPAPAEAVSRGVGIQVDITPELIPTPSATPSASPLSPTVSSSPSAPGGPPASDAGTLPATGVEPSVPLLLAGSSAIVVGGAVLRRRTRDRNRRASL